MELIKFPWQKNEVESEKGKRSVCRLVLHNRTTIGEQKER